MSIKKENLIKYEGTILPGQRFAKVGNKIMPVGVGGAFEPGSGSGSEMSGYVVVEEDGVLKAQKLSFDGTTPIADGAAEPLGSVGMFATGVDEPAYAGSGGGGSAKYYKCASVDTTAKTWTGYEAIQDEQGYWSFSTETTNLTYSDFYVPVIGNIYDETASIFVASLYNKLVTENTVFLLDRSLTDSSTNNIPVTNNGLTVSKDGIVYAQDSYAYIPATALPETVLSAGYPWTLEIRFRCTDLNQLNKICAIFGHGHDANRFDLAFNNSNSGIGIGGFSFSVSYTHDLNWHTLKITHSADNLFILYVDDVYYTQEAKDISPRLADLYLGWDGESSDRYGNPFVVEYIRISDVII